MSLKVRKTRDKVVEFLVLQFNALRDSLVAANFHACATATTSVTGTATVVAVTKANASDLPTSVALCNDVYGVLNVHFVDSFAHNTAVSAKMDVPPATDLATAITRANACKTAFGTHLAAAGVHFNNDATNTILAVNASDQASLNTLLNELKTDVNAHIAGALAGQHIELVSP